MSDGGAHDGMVVIMAVAVIVVGKRDDFGSGDERF